jgi:hypothetical protein
VVISVSWSTEIPTQVMDRGMVTVPE